MPALRATILLGVLLMASTRLGAAQALPADLQQRIISTIQNDRTKYGGTTRVPGAVVSVAIPGEGTFTSGFGYAALDPSRPMQSADHFRIGSNTGTFVAALILQEADRGKLKLDARLSSFALGVIMPNQDAITVRDLLQMQSGLPDVFEVESLRDMARNARFKLTPEETLRYVSSAKPLYAPGHGWNFSHTNYLLLGLIYEKTSGQAVSRAIHDRVLQPLRLSKTSYPAGPDLPSPFAHGYQLTEKKAWEDVTLALPPGLGASAGSMISSAADMRRWVKAYVTGEGLSLQAHDGRLHCVPTGAHELSFGFGIGCSNGWYGSSGAIAGYETAAWYYPPKDLTIVVMVNAKSHDGKSLGIADRMLRDVARTIAAPAVPFG